MHVDPPLRAQGRHTYLRRSGWTGRARDVVTTIATPYQTGDVTSLLRKARIRPHMRVVVSGGASVFARSERWGWIPTEAGTRRPPGFISAPPPEGRPPPVPTRGGPHTQ
ncbi:MAG TPA: hypothetical protein VNF50_14690 [Acidimicrobiales bacterium]|nr:hypothetical protein [Acidimicrobiales bacterium]